MASESGKAVPYATHSANEGHRHRRQPLQHSFGYQQEHQGQDTGAKRGKMLGANAQHASCCLRWTAVQDHSQTPCHPPCPSEGSHRALSHVHRQPPCRSSHACAHRCCLHVAVAHLRHHSANGHLGALACVRNWQSQASPYVDRRVIHQRRHFARLHHDTSVRMAVLQSL